MNLLILLLSSIAYLIYYIIPIVIIISFPILLIKEVIPYIIFVIKFYLKGRRLR